MKCDGSFAQSVLCTHIEEELNNHEGAKLYCLKVV